MAKQTINIGTTANDGTGDPIRTAFDKVNDNFTELYTDDAGDVNSVTATAPLSGDATTGAITLSLSDDSIKEVKLDCTNSPTDNYLLSYDSATEGFTWVEAATGDITGVTAGDGLSGGGTSGTVTVSLASASAGDGLSYSSGVLAVGVDDSTVELNSDAVRVKDLGIATAKLANDSVTSGKLGAEYTTVTALSSAASIAVDTSLSDVFTFTAGHSFTLNFTNVVIGDMKSFMITGGGSSYTAALGTSNGSACTFNKISGTYSDTGSAKNLIQIKWVAVNEAWYTISQIAS